MLRKAKLKWQWAGHDMRSIDENLIKKATMFMDKETKYRKTEEVF